MVKPPVSEHQKFGMVAIVGEPNVGKSTLTNMLVGQKVTITSRKPQTTQSRLTAIIQKGDTQIALIDTPGIFSATNKKDKAMVKVAWQALKGVDVVMLVLSADKIMTKNNLRPAIEFFLTELERMKISPLLVINKIDKIEKENLLPIITALKNFGKDNITDIIMVSATKNKAIDILLQKLLTLMPNAAWGYDPDMASDLPDRNFAAEILREKLFDFLHQELPYGLTVETDQWKIVTNKNKKILHIKQTIYVEKENHRPMILGKNGERLKKIATNARHDMEKIFEEKIFLKILIRVRH